MYLLAQTTFSLNDAMDILELKAVHNSWQAAAMKNVEDARQPHVEVQDIDQIFAETEEAE